MTPIPPAAVCPVVAQLDPCASDLRALGRFPTVAEIDRAISPRAGVRFEEAPPKGRRRRTAPVDASALYDGRIVGGSVPTRAQNHHDLWNALVWSAFPRAKRALHARQHRAIQASIAPGSTRLPGSRTREQDTLAMLDEGGVAIACTSDHAKALARDIVLRSLPEISPLDRGLPALVFGHALFEAFAAGKHRVMGLAVVVDVGEAAPADLRAACDLGLAGMLSDAERFHDPSSGFGVFVLDGLVEPAPLFPKAT